MLIRQLSWLPGQGWDVVVPSDEMASADFVLYFFGPGLEDLPARLAELGEKFPGAALVGCSTGGEIIGDEVFDNSLVASAVKFERTAIHVAKVEIAGDTSRDVGRRLAAEFPRKDLRGLFVLSDGTGINGSDLIRGFRTPSAPASRSPAGWPAMAPISASPMSGRAICRSRAASPRSASMAMPSSIGHGSYGGWQPFGPERRITRAVDNVLHQLDNEPALDLYKRYLGEQAEGLPGTALLFPLRLTRPDGGEVVRTVVGTDDATSTMVFAGDVPEGSTAQLMRATFDKLIDGAGEAADQAAVTEGTHLAILVSCIGRKLVLGQRVAEEVESALDVLGDRCAHHRLLLLR